MTTHLNQMVRWTVANSTAREALTVSLADVGKICNQADALYMAILPGTGATCWKHLPYRNYAVVPFVVQASLDDASTTIYAMSPVAGDIIALYSVIEGVLTGGDPTLTFSIGTTAITGGVITIANAASAAGDVDVATPTAANTVAVTDYVKCVVAANSQSNNVNASMYMVVAY